VQISLSLGLGRQPPEYKLRFGTQKVLERVPSLPCPQAKIEFFGHPSEIGTRHDHAASRRGE
jgi:hypothetical protein